MISSTPWHPYHVELLHSQNMDLTNIVHINALLSSMADFPRFNNVYSTMFGTNPPARACVGVDLPWSRRVSLECLAFETASPQERFALHVQGLSYWAPANIGPYSQAIIVSLFLAYFLVFISTKSELISFLRSNIII
jgi:diphthine-ammonia ligase